MKTLLIGIIVIFCSFVGVSFSTVSAQVISEPAKPVHYQFSQMASSGNNVYVTYQENIGNGDGASVFFRKSSDAGSSFDKIIPLSSTRSAANPLVAASENNVYVTWIENLAGQGHSYVMFERSSDSGNTFSAPIILSNNTDGDANIQQIIADRNNVYVLIDNSSQGNTVTDLSFRASHDNGTTFGDSIVLLENTKTSGTVNISDSQDGKTIYAFGEDDSNCPVQTMNCQYQVFLRKSTDNGLSFTKPTIIKTVNEPIAYPQITTSEHNVYLAWGEQVGDNLELFLVKSNDDGITFSKPVVFSEDTGSSSFPQITANGKNVFVVWYYSNEDVILNEKYNNNTLIDSPVSGIFFTKSSDGGNTLSNPINLSGAVGTSYWSNNAASGDNVFVSWGTKFGDKGDVFFRKSIDNGTTFDHTVKLTDTKQDYFQMQMISSGNHVYIAIDTSLPGDDLLLAASNDNGNTFGNIVNLNHDVSVPEFPFAVPVMLIGIVSVIAFYKVKFRK